MRLSASILALAAALVGAGPARADTLITFDELAEGAVLSLQYSALGVEFEANARSGPGSSSSGKPWASNTDMTVTHSVSGDVGGLGGPALVSGMLLHSFNGWLSEDGDPSFWIKFTAGAVGSVSLDFAGLATPADVRLFAYNGDTLLGSVGGTGAGGQQTLSFSAAAITRVAVAPGSYNDWVGVDNLRFAPAVPVPEPASYALLALGLVGLLAQRRGCGGSGA